MKDIGQRIQTGDDSNDIAIKVEHVSKTFRLPHNRQNSLKGSLINLVKGGERSYEKQEVLKDVSFEIKKGEFFGIVGRNGSGKSTLLKMLAGIYKPTKGKITVNGSLTPFIELGVGFNPELTGRENVFLNGALLGFSRQDMEAMYDDIVAFAELERFMDQKLKNYSSGMQVRLAFSIAIRARSAILLLDEVLAVGDEAFQHKCYEYFGSLKKEQKTVILVTHDMGAVERFCNRAFLIENGQILKVGTSTEIASLYSDIFVFSSQKIIENSSGGIRSEYLKSVEVSILQGGKKVEAVESQKKYVIQLSIDATRDLGPSGSGINIINSQGQIIHSMGTGDFDDRKIIIKKGKSKINFEVENVLNDDIYTVSVAIESYGKNKKAASHYVSNEAVRFIVRGVNIRTYALTHPSYKIEVIG